MSPKKLFGTDGIRGVANVEPLTADLALNVGRAVKEYFAGKSKRIDNQTLILIGKDTRRSSYMFELALAAGITSLGGKALLLGPMPTPGVAYLTRSMRADAGIMVSASHNSYEYNGIKIFGHDGFKLNDQEEAEIEDLILKKNWLSHLPTHENLGPARRIDDVMGRYIVTVKNSFPEEIDLSGFRIILDCANGAAYSCAPRVFNELNAEVITFGIEPNGTNINEKCGALYPQKMCEKVSHMRADIGFALDGDADRIVVSDENGELLDGDQLLAILAIHLKNEGRLYKDTLVVTRMSNMGLELALRKNGIKIHYSKEIGDRSVVNAMKKHGFTLGGEQSGHIVFSEFNSTGDGLIAALNLLAVIKKTGKKISQLKKVMDPLPQVLKNIKVTHKPPLEGLKNVQAAILNGKNILKDKGRVLVRYSGTEPLCRVMVEGESSKVINSVANELSDVIKKSVNI